jgi:hypothetical protein
MSVRTLPMRVTPLPDEALDSWLETLAHKHQCRFGDLLHHMGIERRGRWIVMLRDPEIVSVAESTGVDRLAIHTLTLERFNGTALEIDPINCRITRTYGWASRRYSRFCPQCLADTGGRWQLAWRLRWSFACVAHRCILADQCQACRCLTRTALHPHARVPRPGFCAQRRRDANHHPAQTCNANLAAQEVITIPDIHPILEAQRLISTAIRTDTAAFGLYANNPCTARAALTDIKFIGAPLLSRSNAPSFARTTLPPSLLKVYLAARGGMARCDSYTGFGVAADSPLATAVASTLATSILQCRDIDRAAEKLRLTLAPQTCGQYRSSVPPQSTISHTLHAVIAKACTKPRGRRSRHRRP